MRIGAHMSVAGGVSNAVRRAHAHHCESLQIFTKNASQWKSKPLDPAEVARFRSALADTNIHPVVSHASYLINMATTAPGLREQSAAALADELERAAELGLSGVVIHPGTCTGGDEPQALALIAETIRAALRTHPRRKTMILLEHTAGQGRTVGHRFEQLASILEHLDGSSRVGVCLDTCHLIASGYDIRTEEGYAHTFAEFDRLIGLDRLKVFHGNDSKKPCGSRVDRHEHIGDGCLGLGPFRRLLHDSRFQALPILIETAKARASENPRHVVIDPYDEKNLSTLRALRDQC